MKIKVGILAAQAAQRCTSCGLDGHSALRGESEASTAIQVWRHSVCNHIMMYRSAFTRVEMPGIKASGYFYPSASLDTVNAQ